MRLKPLNQITVLLKRAVGLGAREPLASSCTSLVAGYGTNLSSTVNMKSGGRYGTTYLPRGGMVLLCKTTPSKTVWSGGPHRYLR